MFATPNTTVSILRPGSVDDYTGEVTGETISATGVLASIMEQSRTVFDPASGTPTIVRFTRGRLPSGTSVTTNDRVLDERTSLTYVVQSVRQVQSPVHTNDVTVELVRLGSVGNV